MWVLLLVPACFHPSYDHPMCGPNGECPSGLTCSTQLICERGDISDASSSDAPSVDAAPPPLPSCVGLATTCGASDSCCSSPVVTGGTYYRSYDKAADGSSGDTSYPATVSDFRLDKYEVTVGRFRAFVNAGMGTQASPPMSNAGAHASIAGSGWDASWNASLAADKAALVAAVKCDSTYQTWTDTPAANEHRPMNCIDWYEAMAFCAWDGGYLATEAEWNYAATGGDQQRAYPWSSPAGSLTPLDSAHASYNDGTGCVGDGMPSCALTDLVAVGTKPLGDGRWGQSDLGGNVFEWTLDWYAAYVNPCTNCANITTSSSRVVRGGGFSNDATLLRAGYRGNLTPSGRSGVIGVRCARTP
jgi:formylglycine-generating enzyme required for sulfatase activity